MVDAALDGIDTTVAIEASEATDTDSIAKSIWQLTENMLELLRSRSTSAIHRQKRPDLLWLDDLTETQEEHGDHSATTV